MELKAGYKNTDIGIIPVEWEIEQIQELIKSKVIIEHLDGNHGALYPKSSEFKRDGVPYIGANDFKNGLVDFNNCKFLSKERASLFLKGISKDGDVLFAHNATVGPVALLKTKLDFVILSTTATYFRCNKNKLSNLFLLNFFQSQYFIKQYSAVMSQSTRNQVPITVQKKFFIPLLPLPEQTAIAKVLSDTDQLLQALQKKIAKKRLIKKGAMQVLLKPKEGWVVKSLGEISHIKTGSKNNQDKIVDGQYPFFVRSQTVERINSYSYDCEAILIPGEGGIGSIYHYINGKFDVHQRVYKISEFGKEVSGKFIYLYMLKNFNSHAMKNSVKATVDSLRLPTFLEFEIFLPKIEEQIQIATILSDIDAEIEQLQKKLSKYKMVKQGLMQNLLTGKIRLV